MKKQTNWIIVLAVIAFISCRKGTPFSKEIINNTEFDITIYFYNNSIQYNADSVNIKAFNRITYYTTELRETNTNPNNLCDPQILPNDFFAKVSDNRTLIKNISYTQNWICENIQGSRKATFTIGYEDIQ